MIRLENIEKAYGTKQLFAHITYQFPAGETIALIGDNGAGKSTLLDILCGLESADGGSVLIPPKMSIGYLPQEPNPHPEKTVLAECEAGDSRVFALKQAMEQALLLLENSHSEEHLHAYERAESAYRNADGYSVSAKAGAILSGLGFKDDKLLANPLSLSGGWRMRLELAKLFMKNPDFLILDEPTNHLDLPSLVWVEKYLESFPGTILFVSHDRDLLNRLAKHIIHLNQGKLTAYKGNYDAFLQGFALVQSQEEKEKAKLQAQRQQLETFVTRFGAKASKAKQAQAKMKVIEKIDAHTASLTTTKLAAGISFSLPTPPPVDRIVYRVEHGSIGYSQPLHRDINLQIERGNKIAVIGANGIGKSTLLKTMSRAIPALGGSFVQSDRAVVSYFSQNQLDELEGNKTVLDNLLDKSGVSEKEGRKILGGFLFKGDDVFKPVKVLSGGEKSRVGLAIVLARQANFLILDEPTNHLDLTSCACLTQALQEYKGTVIFVSHDRSFINQICSHVFVMTADGRSMLFAGTIEDYLLLASKANFPNVLQAELLDTLGKGSKKDSASNAQSSDQLSRELKKRRESLDKLLQKTEDEIARLQKVISTLDSEMADPKHMMNFSHLGELQQQRTSAAALLEDQESIWLEKHEEREALAKQLQDLNRG